MGSDKRRERKKGEKVGRRLPSDPVSWWGWFVLFGEVWGSDEPKRFERNNRGGHSDESESKKGRRQGSAGWVWGGALYSYSLPDVI